MTLSKSTLQTPLSPRAKSYLWFDQGIAAAAITCLINYLLGLQTYSGITFIPSEGENGFIKDIEITCFLLPFIGCILVSRLTRFQIMRGRFEQRELFRESIFFRTFTLAMIFGVLGRMAVAPLIVNWVRDSQITEIAKSQYLTNKSIGAAIGALILCPLFAWIAMNTVETGFSRKRPSE